MSTALQSPFIWGVNNTKPQCRNVGGRREHTGTGEVEGKAQVKAPGSDPDISVAFYRRHTEKMLRRYLYASMQVGRAPSVLGEPIARGWASSRPVKTFEDAVIFVLDIERCINELDHLDRQILFRVVLQEYTQAETACLLGMSGRTIGTRFPQALDRLTEKLLGSGLLVLAG
jgi:Sigma-70, region 4